MGRSRRFIAVASLKLPCVLAAWSYRDVGYEGVTALPGCDTAPNGVGYVAGRSSENAGDLEAGSSRPVTSL